ncbi:AMP-binding protein [Parablautia sp. Marseille-Q6255]|uniref:AMP-binding protein n=1 Tax=Parablautia sp. Marseille-Q6255 TaxID=3039593 RepID=UPI0024BC3A1D|nr:AMP-binding protein [Parablautia sp. Marseille-Q6255]
MSFYNDYGRFGEQTAFLDDRGISLTYRELEQWTMRRKEDCGLRPRSLAFVLCENSVGSALGYLTFLRAEIVPLLLDRKIDRDLLDHLMEVYRPEYLYYPADTQERFGDSVRVLHEEYGYVLAEVPDAPHTVLYEELALLLTTSGSTGSPKLVRQSYKNIQSNAEAIAEYLELDEAQRPVSTLPMNYTYGLSVINSHLQVGATILLTDKTMMMKKFWDFMKEHQATSIAGVPFTYELLKKIRFFKMDLPALQYMTQAGGKLSPELHREFAQWAVEHGKKFIVMYGQTEATARMAYLPADKSLEKYGSMGIAIPGGSFSLIDADGEVINAPEQVGELVYDGDNVTLGYAQCREDLQKGDERGGRLITGDMAKRDADGFYYIVGRKKRFLKIFGNRVNLDEIDRMIKTRYEGMDCASTGVDDRMQTFITQEQYIDEVRRYLSNTTHLSESAFTVRYIEAIPKNEAGKTLYKELPV